MCIVQADSFMPAAFVPPTATVDNKTSTNGKDDEPPADVPQQLRRAAPGPRPKVNPNLDTFEAVMEAMEAELGRSKPSKVPAAQTTKDKGKAKATEPELDAEGDIEAAMDAELQGLMNGDDGDDDDIGSAGHMDYNLIKNFLESFKSQNGLAGPVGNLVGRLQPGWTLPRDEL